MADKKISALTALTDPATGDLLVVVDDPSGSPTTKKITIGNLLKSPGPIGGTTPAAGAFTTLSVSGGQIAFPANAVPSADPNTLDDYEEGTWTPTIAFGGASVGVTYSTNAGFYTKIGNIVVISGQIVMTAKGTSTGNAVIAGLPFTIENGPSANYACAPYFIALTFANQILMRIIQNTNTIGISELTEAGTFTYITNANFDNATQVTIGATYRAA